MRPLLPLVGLLCLAGCATSTPAPAHPPLTPSAPAETADLPPVEGTDFRVYRADGSPATLAEMVAEAGGVEAVLFGEQHDDPVTHRVQTELLRQLFAAHAGGAGGRTLVLTLEMFERDVQVVLDEYLSGLITESHFRDSARPWDRYESHYRPAVEFARVHRIPVVAANAPRRYVNRASRLGRESLRELSAEALAALPPLPYPEASAAYRAEWDALMGPQAAHMQGSPLDAQTLWDASMAHAVAQALDRHERGLVLHLTGSFHVANGTGTPDALEHYRPGTSHLIVVAEPTPDVAVFDAEYTGLGDFVILTRRR